MNNYKITLDRWISLIGGSLPLIFRIIISLSTNRQIEMFDTTEVLYFGITICLTDTLFFLNQNKENSSLSPETPIKFIIICILVIALLCVCLTLALISKHNNYNNTWILILSCFFSVGSLSIRRLYNYYKDKK